MERSTFFYSISWDHIDGFFQKSGLHIDSYFLEYQATDSFDNLAPKVNQTSVLSRSTKSYKLVIEDNCLLYSIILGVIPKHQSTTLSNCPRLLYSKAKVVWPAGRHTIGE